MLTTSVWAPSRWVLVWINAGHSCNWMATSRGYGIHDSAAHSFWEQHTSPEAATSVLQSKRERPPPGRISVRSPYPHICSQKRIAYLLRTGSGSLCRISRPPAAESASCLPVALRLCSSASCTTTTTAKHMDSVERDIIGSSTLLPSVLLIPQHRTSAQPSSVHQARRHVYIPQYNVSLQGIAWLHSAVAAF